MMDAIASLFIVNLFVICYDYNIVNSNNLVNKKI